MQFRGSSGVWEFRGMQFRGSSGVCSLGGVQGYAV